METWLKLSLLLCVFGFMKEIRPSEPYVTPYLEGKMKGFSDQDVEKIFSTGTYTYLGEITFVFLITDLLRYKPVIILDGMFAVVTWSLLTFGEGVAEMQIMETFYSFFMAGEVAYYTYIYAQVDREHYVKVTSHTRAAYLLGRGTAGVLSQILVSTDAMTYYQLNFITLAAVCFAALWAWFLPSVKHSIYFFRDTSRDEISDNKNQGSASGSLETQSPTNGKPKQSIWKRFSNRTRTAFYYMWKDFTRAYTNIYVAKWSIWWALATCGFLQMINYVQLIWHDIDEVSPMNGGVEALYTLIGAATSLSLGWLRFNWKMVGEATLAVCSIIEGLLLYFTSTAESMPVAYTCYILFGAIYHTMITVADGEIAKQLHEDSYGLIFGVNTFVALVLQVILTIIVVDERGLYLGVRTQFVVYGGYFIALGVVFGIMAIVTLCNKDIRKQKLWLPKETAGN